ncbi:MAG TPA: hypothetical protein VFN41_08130 [Candidatus Limnocylindrales bacterium]|nr:hypothetical protein [Candidatus Limnocylindrales bacterium]
MAPVGRPIRGAVRCPPLARRRSAWPAQADAPRALADFELTETGRAKLRDERRQELVGQSVDRGVIRGALRGIPLETGIA